MSLIEILAVLTALLYLVLAIKENRYCWPAAIISSLLYIFVFIEVKLYLEACLQVFFIVLSVRGWLRWEGEKALSIHCMNIRQHIFGISGMAFLAIFLAQVLIAYTDASLPYVDALITCFSIYATFLVNEKYLENWIYWVVIDAIAVIVYFSKGLEYTTGLFLAYTILAIQGYFVWKKNYAGQNSTNYS